MYWRLRIKFPQKIAPSYRRAYWVWMGGRPVSRGTQEISADPTSNPLQAHRDDALADGYFLVKSANLKRSLHFDKLSNQGTRNDIA